MLGDLRRDLHRYAPASRVPTLASLQHHGAWASIGFRFATAVEELRVPEPVRLPLRALAALLLFVVRTVTNIDIPVGPRIGGGLYMPHTGYIVVARGSVIGENCTLTPGVVLGHALGGARSSAAAPRLGDRVYLGPGAKVIGPVEIGDDALVGVGAVVTRSLPARGVAVGNPARVIGSTGAFDVLSYPGMESDPARAASLALVGQTAEGG